MLDVNYINHLDEIVVLLTLDEIFEGDDEGLEEDVDMAFGEDVELDIFVIGVVLVDLLVE